MKRWKPLAWFLVSLLCFFAAYYSWQWGERRGQPQGVRPAETTSSVSSATSGTGDFRLVSQPVVATNGTSATSFADEVFPYRLRNTPATVGELIRSDTALLLENALIDTARGGGLAVPDHLRAQGDPGTYIIQASGPITEEFRRVIAAAGGTVVSYVPNNAYLVRASAAAVSAMGASPLSRSVVPFEPYFKIKGGLLETAVKQEDLPQANRLSVVLFEDARDSTVEALEKLGAVLLAEDRSPFGPVVRVQVPKDALPQVASLSGVQIVDGAYERVLANDLSRARIGVSANSSNAPNYLNLTGSNVVIQIADSGVDATHPDLIGRVTGSAASRVDTDAHGTHVAGTIAGDGSVSTTVSNAPGSAFPIRTNQFRGMAPAATLVSVGAIGGGEASTDSELQESAANNGALISNNSWRQLGNTTYDIVAASYDAATRDALPLENGSQPVLFVFAAGNEGVGNEDGTGGFFDTIGSPATAKNVITVGAIENFRDITNDVVICEGDGTNEVCYTNSFVEQNAPPPFEGETDSDSQVASFSSRGNVGIGLEGDYGRFKPDVVAPGTAVLSTRSAQWDEDAYYEALDTQFFPETFFNDPIEPGQINEYLVYIPEDATELEIYASTSFGQLPMDLPIYVYKTALPEPDDVPLGTNRVVIPSPTTTTLEPRNTIWSFGVGNPTDEVVKVDVTWIVTTTNANPFFTQGLKDLNSGVAPYYRFESGTSMAAPAISGALALIQEFFQEQLNTSISPALLKALVINGSRSVSPAYNFQVNNLINYQGWGIFNLPNVIPPLTNLTGSAGAPIVFYDQSPTNALATGQSYTRNVTLSPAAQNPEYPLRFTLVWTDPPGNPLVGAKLVNDLDLIVTNLDSGEVFFGNDIQAGSDFNQGYEPCNCATEAFPDSDVVNNVENVFIVNSGNTNFSRFSVTVVARRVNRNAVNDDPDNTTQDYALVISSGDASVATAITVTASTPADDPSPQVTYLPATLVNSNITATFLEAQRAGENTPLLGTTNGMTNQWQFYAMTNTSDFTNAAFVTFLSSTLSLPRMGVFADDEDDATRFEADIDLYVSDNAGLVDLETAVVENAYKSVGRGGTEMIVLSNAAPNTVYYIGVKSEDHEAANYRFFAAFSLLPFSLNDENGTTLRGIPVPSDIPDGSPAKPGAALILGLAAQPVEVRRVIVTNTVTHQNYGDLVSNLSHDDQFAVLNNHTFPDPEIPGLTNYTYIYEDNEEGDIPDSETSDGPGSLRNFVGEEGLGVWLFSMLDDSLTQTGRVEALTIRLERNKTNYLDQVIAPRSWFYGAVNVPPEATNLIIRVEIVGSQPLPVELYIRKGDFPDFDLFDRQVTIYPPGDQESISIYDVPPLVTDRYYFGIYNPNDVSQTVNINIEVQLGLDGRDTQPFTSFGQEPITDDAVSYAYQEVEEDRRISGLAVGLSVEHPRVSDMVFTLVSPLGKRILLVENRGGTNTAGFGGGSVYTNAFRADSGGALAETNIIPVGANQGTLIVDYQFFTFEDRMRVYYDGTEIYDTGLIGGSDKFSLDFGPGASTDLVITMNEDNNPEANTLWNYDATVIANNMSYLVLTENTNDATTPIKFGVPPFVGSTTPTTVFFSGFEEPTIPGTYTNGNSPFDGWTAGTNQVTVVGNVADAYEGTNFTAMEIGRIQQVVLPTTPGQDYVLNYAVRADPRTLLQVLNIDFGGETNVISPQTGYAATGLSDSDFWNLYPRDDGAGDWRRDGTLTNLLWSDWGPSGITLSVTNAPGLATNGAPEPMLKSYSYPLPNGNGPITLELSGVPDGSYDLYLYSIGGVGANSSNSVSVGGVSYGSQTNTAASVWPPGYQLGNQYVVFSDLDVSGGAPIEILVDPDLAIEAIINGLQLVRRSVGVSAGGVLNGGAHPALEVTLSNVVSQAFIVTNQSWQTRAIAFTAPETTQLLEFAGLTNGVWIDAISVDEVGSDVAYLPEESLNALIGDDAAGLWTLEMWDNRAGASNGPPELVSWQLDFTYATESQAPLPIETGVAITNTIPPGEIFQLVVDVPNWATWATNTLIFATNDPVNVWVNPTNIITTTNAGDVLKLTNSNAGVFELNATSAPPLVPSGRYFVGIQNPGTNTVTFAYRIDFDITALTNGVPAGPYTLDTNFLGGFLRYFSYEVSSNATAVTFDLFDLDGDVNLVASKGRLPLPQYDYGSFNSGTNAENITVFTNSTPVALAPGRWYLGVVLADTQAVTYTIQATEYTDDFSGLITLTNREPYIKSSAGLVDLEDHYRFSVPDPVARIQFDILNPTADVTMLVRRGLPLPNLGNYDYISANGGLNDEYILVLPNSTPVRAAGGEWFITVVNNSGMAADYTIVASFWQTGAGGPGTGLPGDGDPITLFNWRVQSNMFCFSWNSLPGARYVVEGKMTLSDANWVDHSGTITATNIVTSYCVALPSPYHFFRVREGIAVDPGSGAQVVITQVSSTPGGVTIEWQAPPTLQFDVQYSDGLPAVWNTVPGGPITSTDGNFTFTDDGTQTGGFPLPPVRFYRLVVVP